MSEEERQLAVIPLSDEVKNYLAVLRSVATAYADQIDRIEFAFSEVQTKLRHALEAANHQQHEAARLAAVVDERDARIAELEKLTNATVKKTGAFISQQHERIVELEALVEDAADLMDSIGESEWAKRYREKAAPAVSGEEQA